MKIKFEDFDNIYLVPGATDLRKSYAGLSAMVSHNLYLDPTANNLYIFCSRNKRTIKMLEFDKNGFVIHSKKLLNTDRFYWPKAQDDISSMTVDLRQLNWLLDGLEIEQKRAFKDISVII